MKQYLLIRITHDDGSLFYHRFIADIEDNHDVIEKLSSRYKTIRLSKEEAEDIILNGTSLEIIWRKYERQNNR